jgi:hypothetical protein
MEIIQEGSSKFLMFGSGEQLAEIKTLLDETTGEGRTEFGFGFGNVLIKIVAVAAEIKDQKFSLVFSDAENIWA